MHQAAAVWSVEISRARGVGKGAGEQDGRTVVMSKRQDFSHRGADAKSLLDEVLRCGRGSVWGAGWQGDIGRAVERSRAAESRRILLGKRAA